jgi:hypothetical protein
MDINWAKTVAGVPLTEDVNMAEVLRLLDEAVTDLPGGLDLNQMFSVAAARLDASRRALGIANRLATPEERRKHRSRIMIALNSLRGLLGEISRELGDTRD